MENTTTPMGMLTAVNVPIKKQDVPMSRPPQVAQNGENMVVGGIFAGAPMLHVVMPHPEKISPNERGYWEAIGLPFPDDCTGGQFAAAVQRLRDENTKWPLEVARTGARWLLKRLMAADHRKAMIVGSVRRCKELVGDIEILIEPSAPVHADLLHLAAHPNSRTLDDVLSELVLEGALIHRAKNSGEKMRKYFLDTAALFGGIPLSPRLKVDLFIVTPPAQWGVLSVIRTGPAEYSKWMMTARPAGALPVGVRCTEGHLERNGETLLTPDEDSVYRLCGLPYADPLYRKVPQ